MGTEFNIEDVREWLGCSRKAGNRIWLDSNFFDSMKYDAIKRFPKNFKKMDKTSLHAKLKATHFDLEQVSTFLVWELQSKIKSKQDSKEQDYNFPDLPRFISYIQKSSSNRLFDAVVKHLKECIVGDGDVLDEIEHEKPRTDMDSEPGRNEGEQKTGAAGESSQSDDSEDDSEMTAPSTWKKKYFEEEMDPDNDPNRRLTCQSFIQSAERLLDAFERYPLTNAVKDFFSLLKQCSEDLGLSRLGVINMIEKGHEHMSFHKGIKTRLGSSFKQG